MSIASRTARSHDVSSWLELVSEVEELFGPMLAFEAHLRTAIARGTAIVVAAQHAVAGGALLSSDDRTHRILWLAVRRSQRGRGVGAALVTAALERWPVGDIEVVTFLRKCQRVLRHGDPTSDSASCASAWLSRRQIESPATCSCWPAEGSDCVASTPGHGSTARQVEGWPMSHCWRGCGSEVGMTPPESVEKECREQDGRV
jgi:GNAT superfamily N-acetyltransferase